MKKTCFVLLVALLLGLAPSTFAADGSAFGGFDALLARLVAFFSDPTGSLETGEYFPPGGYSDSGELLESAEYIPPSGDSDSGEVLEISGMIPPSGYSDSGEVLELGEYIPPHG